MFRNSVNYARDKSQEDSDSKSFRFQTLSDFDKPKKIKTYLKNRSTMFEAKSIDMHRPMVKKEAINAHRIIKQK